MFAGEGAVAIKQDRQQELMHLLRQDCGSCHGLTLKGGLGPSLLPNRLGSLPVSILTSAILDGRPGTAMPPWRGLVSPEEAQWLAMILKKGIDK
ncbi:MAG: cytochrome c [Gammaproteobacteria bacterium]|nr:cytochrome c [Gammaproteobacteria bacterium]